MSYERFQIISARQVGPGPIITGGHGPTTPTEPRGTVLPTPTEHPRGTGPPTHTDQWLQQTNPTMRIFLGFTECLFDLGRSWTGLGRNSDGQRDPRVGILVSLGLDMSWTDRLAGRGDSKARPATCLPYCLLGLPPCWVQNPVLLLTGIGPRRPEPPLGGTCSYLG